MLSDADIRQSIASGRIEIDPFDATRLNPASYTLSLGGRLLVPRAGKIIDANKPQLAYKEIEITEDGYTIQPGEFLLGSVAEQLSIATTLAARLDARTSLARLGVNVLQGSTHIEPGQQASHETLEVCNIGPSPVLLHAGMKIVKVIFMQLQTAAAQGYTGSYARQQDGRVK